MKNIEELKKIKMKPETKIIIYKLALMFIGMLLAIVLFSQF